MYITTKTMFFHKMHSVLFFLTDGQKLHSVPLHFCSKTVKNGFKCFRYMDDILIPEYFALHLYIY